jgi:beta-galactosidase/beta-glucuronidase
MTKSYLQGHPRPQFTRPAWEDLNGTWDFAFDDAREGQAARWYDSFPKARPITVPFSYETVKSGIGEERFHPVVWYKRTFTPQQNGKRVVLHFEGVDYRAGVWINGRHAGSHVGGYARFSIDVTDLLVEGENVLTVRAEDSDDLMQPRGKQRWKTENFGCWYVQTTGIWKTVWLEYLPETHLERVKMTPHLDDKSLELDYQVIASDYEGLSLAVEISFGDIPVSKTELPVTGRRGEAKLQVGSVAVHQWLLHAWSPEQPNLYDVRFTLRRNGKEMDEVLSYFGMREIRIEGSRVLLNNRPVYQRLILDQGYWKDSGLTPPDEEAIIRDVDAIRELGYNGARKHQKTEDERFAYWCDVKGLLLWCEMPSPYLFGDDSVTAFTAQWMEIVEQHYNHPSIITWTPFNESWGVAEIKRQRMQQHFTEAIYHLTKSMDNMRPVVSNDGWEHTVTDILTLHDYEELGKVFLERYEGDKDGILSGEVFHNKDRTALAHGYAYTGQPVIISEYGGAAYSGGAAGTWGYGNTVENEQKLLDRIEDMTDAIKKLPWVCGYCYTQITDVQQEINGLLDTDRKFKADPAAIRAINLK